MYWAVLYWGARGRVHRLREVSLSLPGRVLLPSCPPSLPPSLPPVLRCSPTCLPTCPAFLAAASLQQLKSKRLAQRPFEYVAMLDEDQQIKSELHGAGDLGAWARKANNITLDKTVLDSLQKQSCHTPKLSPHTRIEPIDFDACKYSPSPCLHESGQRLLGSLGFRALSPAMPIHGLSSGRGVHTLRHVGSCRSWGVLAVARPFHTPHAAPSPGHGGRGTSQKGRAKASAADKEEGGSEAGEATGTAGTGSQNAGDGRACAWEAATTQGMAWPANPVATGCQGNPCSTGIRWGVSPAAQMGCLRNKRGSPPGASQP